MPREMVIINFKRSIKLLLKDMAGLKRDSQNLKEKCQHGHQIQYNKPTNGCDIQFSIRSRHDSTASKDNIIYHLDFYVFLFFWTFFHIF